VDPIRGSISTFLRKIADEREAIVTTGRMNKTLNTTGKRE